MSANTYYSIHDFSNLPAHILQSESTLCIGYDFSKKCYMRINPLSTTTPKILPYLTSRNLALINPTQEDLTYLTLLGIRYYKETDSRITNIYASLELTGRFRIS